jgi:hypothetical protein
VDYPFDTHEVRNWLSYDVMNDDVILNAECLMVRAMRLMLSLTGAEEFV